MVDDGTLCEGDDWYALARPADEVQVKITPRLGALRVLGKLWRGRTFLQSNGRTTTRALGSASEAGKH
jgi:hypothetical protein